MKKLITSKLVICLLISFVLSSNLALASRKSTPAPDLSLVDLKHNKTVQLKNYAGKVIYLDFWASWCAPCRSSFPLLNKLQHKYNKEGFEVLAINLDEDMSSFDKFTKLYPVDFTLLRDENNLAPDRYKVEAMPSSYVIDKKGNIRYIHRGFKKTDILTIEKQIVQLLSE